jgi:hypothetical protein
MITSDWTKHGQKPFVYNFKKFIEKTKKLLRMHGKIKRVGGANKNTLILSDDCTRLKFGGSGFPRRTVTS